MSHPTVSLCIPTHGRPRYLLEALESGVAQSRPPDEIVVSDDLGGAEIRELVETFARRASFPVRYVHCATGPGQSENVNSCYREASSDLLLLLHDDDLLIPSAIESLLAPFVENPAVVASYGKQILVDDDGTEMPNDSEKLNRNYGRTPETAGLQPDAFLSGIMQHFPNDAYLVKTSIARKVSQRKEVGMACEIDFGIRLGERGAFYFTDEYTAKYRCSTHSVSRGFQKKKDDCAYFTMRLFLDLLRNHPNYHDALTDRLEKIAPIAIAMAINLGKLDEAAAWYFGPYHRSRIVTPGGIRRGLHLAMERFIHRLHCRPGSSLRRPF